MNYVVCYVSTVNNSLEPMEVVEVLDQTEVRNNQLGIRGLLIYSEGNFFEVLEGEEKLVKNLFATIKDDPRHKNIIIIFEKFLDNELIDDRKGEVGFISQSTQYRKLRIENFYDCIKNLDSGTQGVVRNMLIQFGKNSPRIKSSQNSDKDDSEHPFLY